VRPTAVVLAIAATVAAGAFASTGTTSAGGRAGRNAAAATPPYHPKIDPANFTAKVTNPYFPLTPGATLVYTGTKDGAPERVEMKVLRTTRTILGVKCVVISDVVTSNYTLVEKTTDWYAQDKAGNVWYFGETTAEYKNGVVTSTQGTWEAGVDNAQPGIVMHAKPTPGPRYRQEYRPGIAEDMAKVLRANDTRRVPAGAFRKVVVTFDTDPLNPQKLEHKWYAPGVGMIEAIRFGGSHREHIKLVKVTKS
jgi:hypothetical protein